MTRPRVIPDNWAHLDWDAQCEKCGQALFMVGVAEKRLPVSGPIEVTRCPGCTRALFYRSDADPGNVADYQQRVATRAKWHSYPRKRTPAGKGLRTENFPHAD